mmetsp:Transcript_3852/g.8094  ORF Transcript_3852/g.8094 Transcript_3852/m.8094 type:complete len:82 (+) Transcript_3852:162-407(+)
MEDKIETNNGNDGRSDFLYSMFAKSDYVFERCRLELLRTVRSDPDERSMIMDDKDPAVTDVSEGNHQRIDPNRQNGWTCSC